MSLDPASLLTDIDPALLARAAAVRLMLFDIDGVMTDGSLYYGSQGEVLKRFHVLDGAGLKQLATLMPVGIITGRNSSIVSCRAQELGISLVFQGVMQKLPQIVELAEQHDLPLSAVGYMGDDLIDLPALQAVGFAASVPNALAIVRAHAHWVSQRLGGEGAVRECCDLLLQAHGVDPTRASVQ